MSMKCIRRLVALGLSGAMLFSLLSACGGGGTSGAQPSENSQGQEETQQGESTELLVWVPPLDDDTEASWRPMLEKFEEEHNCTVTLEIIPWTNYQEKYTMAINAG